MNTATTRRPTRFAIFLVLLIIPAGAYAAGATPLGVTLSSDTVTVTGVARDHDIIVFGIGIGQHSFSPLLRREVQVGRDDDRDGVVAFVVGNVPRDSVWAVVDARTGACVVATPNELLPAVLAVDREAWRAERQQMVIPTKHVEMLLVRPNFGAWTRRAADGGSRDTDGVQDRRITLRLESMTRLLGEGDGPSHALPRDLLIAIDPHTLRTFVGEAR